MFPTSTDKNSDDDPKKVNFNNKNELNDSVPNPMVIKQEPDIEFPIPETENQNEFEIQNHFQIVSVQSLHPLEKFSEMNESENDQISFEEDTTNHSTIRKILHASSLQDSFGIAENKVNKSTWNDDYDDDNSLLVESKKETRVRRTTKKKKSKLNIFREKLVESLHKTNTPIIDYGKEDDFNIDELSNDSNSLVNEPVLLSSEDQQQTSGSSSFSVRSTRRKSVHKPYDIAMEIVDDDAVKKDRLNQVRSIKNPHIDYIKKVAFLRVCVNYILKELGHPQFNFNRNLTLKYMKNSYLNCLKE